MSITLLTYNLLLLFALSLPAGKILNSPNSGLIRYETNGFRWNTRLAFILLYIVVLASIREAQPGTDYYSYLRYYNYIIDYGEAARFYKENEIGWVYLNLLFGRVECLPEVFFGLISGMTWFFFIKGSYKFQFLLPLMFFFVMTSGFFFWTYNGIRQSIAIMIFFYAIKFIIEKNALRYTLWISIASLFHISVIIMLPFYFIKKIKFNQKLVAILYIISIFLAGNNWFMTKMNELVMLLGTKIYLLSKYENYLGTDSFATNAEGTSSGLGVLLRIITIFYILYKSNHVLQKQPKLQIYFVLFFIGVILSNIFFSVEIIGRISNYFTICFAIVIASTIYYSTGKYEKLVNIMLVGIYILLFNKLLL